MCVCAKTTLIFYWNNTETEKQEDITETVSLCLEGHNFIQYVYTIPCVLIIITLLAVIYCFKLHSDRYVCMIRCQGNIF